MAEIRMDIFLQPPQANKTQPATKPLLTVIIPSYNCAPWLERSVRSTTSLSGCEVKVIIIDDGSTDHTQDVLQNLKHDIPALEIFKIPNGGLSSARNFGLVHASGQYVMFLDADDELIPCDLSLLLATNCDMIRIGVEETLGTAKNLIHEESQGIISGREYLTQGFNKNNFFTPSWAYIYQLPWLQRNNLSFKDKLLHEDNLFTVQALLSASTIIATPALIYRYIRRPDSITTSTSEDTLIARIQAYGLIAISLTEIANQDKSFDLRWKIHEILDGAQRLANHCTSRKGQIIALQSILRFMLSYRGYGQHGFRHAQIVRLIRYSHNLLRHRRKANP